MRFLLALSLSLASTTALAGSKIEPSGAAEATRLKGHVLVWQDAPLFAEPDETARSLKLATFEGSRKDRVGHVIALEVVSAKGAFVEVELTGDEDCTWSRVVVPDDIARVRMFVRRSDLAPVLVKPFTKTFADGSSITLAAGTPVVPTDATTHVVSLRGDEVELEIPAAQIGHAYTPAKSSNAMIAGQTLAIAARTKATLGERALVLTGWKGAPVEKRGDTTLVAIEDRCIAAHLAVPTKALADVDESTIELSGGGGAVMDLRDEFFLPRLTPLMIGTRVVAVAARPIYLHAEPTGKNACIQRLIKLESALEVNRTDERLRVCAPATKVARETMRSARSAHGTTRR